MRSAWLKRLVIAGVAVALLAGIVVASAPWWLSGIGYLLIRDEAPVRAEAIMVLAGDWRGSRIMKACDLAQQGYAPIVLVNGAADWYGQHEEEGAINFAVKHGCPQHLLEPVRLNGLSTAEEAQQAHQYVTAHGYKNILVVTSNFHTARAARIFRREFGRAVQFRFVAAPDRYFSATGWWRNREGRKTVFFELSKTIATLLEN